MYQNEAIFTDIHNRHCTQAQGIISFQGKSAFRPVLFSDLHWSILSLDGRSVSRALWTGENTVHHIDSQAAAAHTDTTNRETGADKTRCAEQMPTGDTETNSEINVHTMPTNTLATEWQ